MSGMNMEPTNKFGMSYARRYTAIYSCAGRVETVQFMSMDEIPVIAQQIASNGYYVYNDKGVIFKDNLIKIVNE